MNRMERLIQRYERAIYGGGTVDEIANLCRAVEVEADKVGYSDHSRLYALHTAAERVCLEEDDEQ